MCYKQGLKEENILALNDLVICICQQRISENDYLSSLVLMAFFLSILFHSPA